MADMQEDIDHRYRALEPVLSRLKDVSNFIVQNALKDSGIKTHSVLSRIKTLDSVRDKAARKGKAGVLDEIEDLLGLRIVCLFRADIRRIGELIREQFEVISEDNKLDGALVESFGYQSVHFIVRLKPSYTGPHYQGLHEQRFEIQLRTIAMDAWATLSHYLDYKNEVDVPKDLRKDFFALSGLFYVADTHFEIFYDARKKSEESAKTAIERPETRRQELDLDTLTAFLRKRYPDRRAGGFLNTSQLLHELLAAGYNDIETLETALVKAEPAFIAFENEEKTAPENKFFDVAVVRLSLSFINSGFRKAAGFYSDTYFSKFYKLISK